MSNPNSVPVAFSIQYCIFALKIVQNPKLAPFQKASQNSPSQRRKNFNHFWRKNVPAGRASEAHLPKIKGTAAKAAVPFILLFKAFVDHTGVALHLHGERLLSLVGIVPNLGTKFAFTIYFVHIYS